MSEQINTLVIPKYEAELEALRSDLRKMILLMSQEREVTEALSAAVLQLRDRLGMPTDELRPPSTSEGATRERTAQEALCGTAENATISTSADIRHTANTALRSEEPLSEPHQIKTATTAEGLDRILNQPEPDVIVQSDGTCVPAQPSEPPVGAGAMREGQEVWVRAEVSVIEEGDDWIEVSFDSATGHQQLSMKPNDVLAARATPVSTEEGRVREALANHWLFEMRCNHEQSNDTPICACGWVGDTFPTVGEAAKSWAKHALELALAPAVAETQEGR